MSASKDSSVPSVQVGKDSVLDELNHSRMEVQWLKWDRDRLSSELEAVKRRTQPKSVGETTPNQRDIPLVEVDSEISWKLPVGESSGYASWKARERSSVGTSPELASGGARHAGSTPVRPIPKRDPCTNPFMRHEVDCATKERGLHCDLLSFATRPTVEKSNEVVQEVDSPGVAPWPLKRESRMVGGDVPNKPQGGKPRRPTITPDRYNGKVLWDEYYRHFEACKKVNQWTEEEATEFLAASLQGEALRVLGDGSKRFTYTDLVKVLERRFGPGRQAENYLVELKHRRQGPKETLQELGQAVRELTVKAYPEIPEEARERLGKNHFMDAVTSAVVREGIYRARPKTLDEAIRAALETDNFERVESERRAERKPTKFTRAVDSGTERRLQQLEEDAGQQAKKIDRMVEMLTELTRKGPSEADKVKPAPRQSPKPRRRKPVDMECFRCGEVGHFRRECTKPRKEKKGQGNASQPTGGPAGRLDIPEGPSKGQIESTRGDSHRPEAESR